MLLNSQPDLGNICVYVCVQCVCVCVGYLYVYLIYHILLLFSSKEERNCNEAS